MQRRQIVVSDLDGTLLGDGAALTRFAKWYEQAASRVALVYASGRFWGSIRACVATTGLPKPDAIIAGVGTEVRCFRTGRELVDWPEVFPTARRPLWDSVAVRDALSTQTCLDLQPDEFQSERKVSYFLLDATTDDLTAIDAVLCHHGLACELIYSSRRYLDILPRGVNKGTAVRQLASLWQVDADSVVVCGDTGNDAAMFQQGYRGVIVSNAQEELKRLAKSTRVYVACRPYAAGVLEGLSHWRVCDRERHTGSEP